MGNIRNSNQVHITPAQNGQVPLGPPPSSPPPPVPNTGVTPPPAPPLPPKKEGVSLTQPELIEEVIDNAPQPEQMNKTEKSLKPLNLKVQENISSSLSLTEQLQQGKQGLKSVNTDDRSGLNPVFKQQALQDTLNLGQTRIEEHEIERKHKEVDLRPLFSQQSLQSPMKSFDNDYIAYVRGGEPQEYLQTHLKQALKNLDKAGASLFTAKSDIKKVVARTELDVQQMVGRLSSQSDLSVFLRCQSESELRQLVSEAVGELKGYSPQEVAELSKKKQQFVEAVVKGIQAGLKQQDTTGLNGQGTPVVDDEPGLLQQSLSKMQEQISSFLEPHGPDSDLKWTLALRSDKELQQMMTEQFGVKKPEVFQSMLQSIHKALPNQSSEQSITLPTDSGNVEVPTRLELNGVSYGQPKYLAEGGFANVVRYTNLNDPNDRVVVKIPKLTGNLSGLNPEQIRQETLKETIVHREIQGEGHPNIIGLKGVIKGSNDQLLIVMENAPQGNLYQGAHRLHEVTQKGLISEDTRQLLGAFFLRGVIQGTQHMQETRQSHHSDFKTPNILIGGDGEVKLTDFGLSGLGLTRQGQKRDVDNPIWLAPELLTTNFAQLGKEASLFAYSQVYQQHLQQINQLLEMDLQTSIQSGNQNLVYSPATKETVFQTVLEQELLKNDEPYKAQILELAQQLKQEQPELSDDEAQTQALQAFKAQQPELCEQLTQKFKLNLCRILMNSDDHQDLDFSTFAGLNDQIKQLRENSHPLIEEYKAQHSITLQQAKMDTWSLGIVATELLLAPTTGTSKDDSPHFGKLDLINNRLFRIENSIKAFAQNNERLSGLSEDVNIRTLARELESDPRFASEAYAPMFRLLLGPEVPLAPKDNSPEALEDYQKDVIGFRRENQLSPEAFENLQSQYSQALQQFQAVLNVEFDQGVTARDKLINGFLHPDPNKRITMSGALQSSLFQDSRLDMPELKQLWRELQKETPDPTEIQRLVGLLGD